MHVFINMKTITIKDEVYEELLKIKGEKSFSELLKELLTKKNFLKDLKGVAKDSKFFAEVEKEILKERKKVKVRI